MQKTKVTEQTKRGGDQSLELLSPRSRAASCCTSLSSSASFSKMHSETKQGFFSFAFVTSSDCALKRTEELPARLGNASCAWKALTESVRITSCKVMFDHLNHCTPQQQPQEQGWCARSSWALCTWAHLLTAGGLHGLFQPSPHFRAHCWA